MLEPLRLGAGVALEVGRQLARFLADLLGRLLGGFEDPRDAVAERRVALRLGLLGGNVVDARLLHGRIGKLLDPPRARQAGPPAASPSSRR